MARVILFTALGAATGASTVNLIDVLSIHYSIHLIPGFVFGAAFGVALLRLELVRTTGALAFVAASTLSNAAAVYLAVAIDEPIVSIPGIPVTASLSVVGLIAGALGGGLLGGATALLLRCPRWSLLIAAGAVLGVLLPLIDLESMGGHFLFFAIWQGGYAATLAAILPRTAREPARSLA